MMKLVAFFLQSIAIVQMALSPAHANVTSDPFLKRINADLTPHKVFGSLLTSYQDEADQKFIGRQQRSYIKLKKKHQIEFVNTGRTYEMIIDGKTVAKIYDFDFSQRTMRINGRKVSFAEKRKYRDLYQDLEKILFPRSALLHLQLIPEADASLGLLAGLVIGGVALFGLYRFFTQKPDPVEQCMATSKVTNFNPPQAVGPDSEPFIRNFYNDKVGFNSRGRCANSGMNGMPTDYDARVHMMWKEHQAGQHKDIKSCTARKMRDCVDGGFNMTKLKAEASCMVLYKLLEYCRDINNVAPEPETVTPPARGQSENTPATEESNSAL